MSGPKEYYNQQPSFLRRLGDRAIEIAIVTSATFNYASSKVSELAQTGQDSSFYQVLSDNAKNLLSNSPLLTAVGVAEGLLMYEQSMVTPPAEGENVSPLEHRSIFALRSAVTIGALHLLSTMAATHNIDIHSLGEGLILGAGVLSMIRSLAVLLNINERQ